MEEEIAAGHLWSAYASDSEYRRLRAVLLAPPDPALAPPTDPNAALHLEPIDYAAVHRELVHVAATFTRLGIGVHFLESTGDHGLPRGGLAPRNNQMFVRDQFFMTREGAVVSRMASKARAGEEQAVSRCLARLGVPILRTVSGTATFEGADALWLTPSLIALGSGRRSSPAGIRQVTACLRESGIDVVEAALPTGVQHLLGIVQVVDRDLAVVRGELLDPRLREVLRGVGIALVELPEDAETQRAQAMNLVTVAPRAVIIPDDVPRTRASLERSGITVVSQVPVAELRKAAGGLACAVGILARERAGARPARHGAAA